MDIYSFEFGSKPVEWFYNEFKDMKFIGTSSRRFKSNRNFLRLDNSISQDDIQFFNGTYYAPAIKIKGDLYLTELNRVGASILCWRFWSLILRAIGSYP